MEGTRSIFTEQVLTQQAYLETFLRLDTGVRACEKLAEYGIIFPLQYHRPELSDETPALLRITELGLNTYFSGSLSFDPERRAAEAHLAFRKKPVDCQDPFERERNRWSNALIDGWTTVWRETMGCYLLPQAKYYSFSENGSTYARLLVALDFPHMTPGTKQKQTTKAQCGSSLPPFLISLITDYNNLSVQSQKTARDYIKTILDVLIDRKATQNGNAHVQIALQHQPSPEHLERQGKLLLDAFNIIYPRLSLSAEDLHIPATSHRPSQTYAGWISIPSEKIIGLAHYNDSPIKVRSLIRATPLSLVKVLKAQENVPEQE